MAPGVYVSDERKLQLMANATEIEHMPRGFSEESHPERERSRRGLIFIVTVVLALTLAGLWGLSLDRTRTAAVGTEVGHEGGTIVVTDAWTIDDPMMAMMGGDEENADQFAQSGMPMAPMSQMMSDAVPEGMKRVAVELDLVAGDRVMTFPGEVMTLEVDETIYAPYSAVLADGQLQPGTRLSGVVTFEIPIETVDATFRLNDDARPVAVDVSMGPDGTEPVFHDHEE